MVDEVLEVEEKIDGLALDNSWEVSKNKNRIAKAKIKFFGKDNWFRCPCYPPTDSIHGCGTEECAKDIEKEGKCHCNLFLKRG